MGAPAAFARSFHAEGTLNLLRNTIATLKSYEFERALGTTLLIREPIGVAGLISPWNVPVGTLMNKVAAAMAAGCTVIVKPSERDAAEPAHGSRSHACKRVCRKGVFNLINGDGADGRAAPRRAS